MQEAENAVHRNVRRHLVLGVACSAIGKTLNIQFTF